MTKGEKIMSNQVSPYISRKPGDLITAQDWNGMQELVKNDMADRIQTALDNLTVIDRAEDADKLGGKTPDELSQQVLEYVLRQLPKRTGYLSVYKSLEPDKEYVIEHKLSAFPLVDVYQLDYFNVVASEDGHVFETLTTFYLYHSSESRIRYRPEEATTQPSVSVEIDPSEGHAYRIPFKYMLELYGVEFAEDSSLGDIETEFWQVFNAAPNDRFSDDQHYHSPWFDRCCKEGRSVHSMARDWDDIWFQVRPRKTINYAGLDGNDQIRILPAPTKVEVVHFDFDNIGLRLLGEPVVPDGHPNDHLKVLVLMKV
jgi:hypothetical protein